MTHHIAFELSIPVTEELLLIQEDLEHPLKQLGAQRRWTSAERLRVPMLSFASLSRDEEIVLRDMLRQVARSRSAVTVEIAAPHFFPSEELPRHVCVHIRDATGDLQALHTQIIRGSEALGLTPLRTEWGGRLSLGRLASARGPLNLQGVLSAYTDRLIGRSALRELLVLKTEVLGTHEKAELRSRIQLGSGK